MELLNDHEYETRYHLGQANVMADALSRKERAKPLRVKTLTLTIHYNLTTHIRDAQMEALKPENIIEEYL